MNKSWKLCFLIHALAMSMTMKWRIDSLNVEKLSISWRAGSRFYHSVIVDELHIRCFVLHWEEEHYWIFTFQSFVKRNSFFHQRRCWDSNPNSWYIFFGCHLIDPVIAKRALCCSDSSFPYKELLRAWWYRTSP